MTTAIANIFNFNGHQVRVTEIDGQPWFVAADVCRALNLAWDKTNKVYAPSSVVKYLDKSEKGRKLFSMSRTPVLIISESGLYKLVMRSNKPEAKQFQHWVTSVVLPAIRKDGAYIKGEEKVVTGELSEEEFILQAMSMMKEKSLNMTTAIATPRVYRNTNNTIVADSRDVAEYFGKEHKHILRDIDGLLDDLPEEGRSNFGLTCFTNPQNGQSYRSYEMTRDGFTLLAMGFTGQKALQFKLRYMAQYNAMEAELKAKTPAIPQTYAEALRLAADEAEMTPSSRGK